LWRLVIASKFGEELGGWTSRQCRGPYGCSLWKGIRAGWDSFLPYVRFAIGDGTRVCFGMINGVKLLSNCSLSSCQPSCQHISVNTDLSFFSINVIST
jgi:hypothetical protein